MSNSAWCDLKSKGDTIKLKDKCPNPICNCQKTITFTPHEYMLEDGSIESKHQKFFRGTQTAGNKFLKPAVNEAAPFIGMALNQRILGLDKLLQIFQSQYREVKFYLSQTCTATD